MTFKVFIAAAKLIFHFSESYLASTDVFLSFEWDIHVVGMSAIDPSDVTDETRTDSMSRVANAAGSLVVPLKLGSIPLPSCACCVYSRQIAETWMRFADFDEL